MTGIFDHQVFDPEIFSVPEKPLSFSAIMPRSSVKITKTRKYTHDLMNLQNLHGNIISEQRYNQALQGMVTISKDFVSGLSGKLVNDREGFQRLSGRATSEHELVTWSNKVGRSYAMMRTIRQVHRHISKTIIRGRIVSEILYRQDLKGRVKE